MAGALVAPQHAGHGRTTRAAVAVLLAGLAVKVAATFKESVVAAIFGRSDAMDAFLAAFLIPNLLINLIAESMNQALIPTLIRLGLREGRERAQQLLSSSLAVLCMFLGMASIAMALLAHTMFPLIAWNFSPAKEETAVRLFYLLLPCLILGGIASTCTAVLNAGGRFVIPALAPAVVPLAIVVAAFAFHASLGIWVLAAATVLGMAAHAAWMAKSMRGCGYDFRLNWHGWTEPLREVSGQYWPALLGSVAASAGLLVDQAMAAMLPAGSVSALVFAARFPGVAMSLLAGATSTALAPYLSELVALRDWRACRSALKSWAARTAILSIAAAGALVAGSRPLVRVVLQHGAFGSTDTRVVAFVLTMYALQIPFFAASRVPYRFLVALRRTDLVLACGAINLVLDVVLNLVLMHWMGVAGIALATSLWMVSTCGFLWYWALRLLGRAERASGCEART